MRDLKLVRVIVVSYDQKATTTNFRQTKNK